MTAHPSGNEGAASTLFFGDPLWVPLLTHYRNDGSVDADRMARHLAAILGSVSQIMFAGSTGDGWEADDVRFNALIDFAASQAASGTRIMFGTLRSGTDEVIARLRHLETRLGRLPDLRERYVGATICPPVDPEATQDKILAHYRRVLAETSSPISVYQLPQVTGCRIAPETLEALAAHPKVIMFKDSSGEDAVAASGHRFEGVLMVRGAEGRYAEAVLGTSGYGGWLLSSANVLPEELRRTEALLREGRITEGLDRSSAIAECVERLFALAAAESGANAFSNANRAGDHVRAYGRHWAEAPLPLKQDGSRLSRDLVAGAAEILLPVLGQRAGYLAGTAAGALRNAGI